MADILLIDDIKLGMTCGIAVITVQEKQNIGVASNSPMKYQRLIFADSKVSWIKLVFPPRFDPCRK